MVEVVVVESEPLLCSKYVDSSYREGGKLEYPEKNPRSTGEINNENSVLRHISELSMFFSSDTYNPLTAFPANVFVKMSLFAAYCLATSFAIYSPN